MWEVVEVVQEEGGGEEEGGEEEGAEEGCE